MGESILLIFSVSIWARDKPNTNFRILIPREKLVLGLSLAQLLPEKIDKMLSQRKAWIHWCEPNCTSLFYKEGENRKKHWPTDVGKWSWICSYDGWTYIVFLFFFRRNLFFVTIILLHSSPNCLIFEHICAKLQLLTSAFSAFAQCKLGTQDS